MEEWLLLMRNAALQHDQNIEGNEARFKPQNVAMQQPRVEALGPGRLVPMRLTGFARQSGSGDGAVICTSSALGDDARRLSRSAHKPDGITYAAGSLNDKPEATSCGLLDCGLSSRAAATRGPRPEVAARRCAVALLPTFLTACDWALLDPRGPVGHAERIILIDSLAIMLAIGVPTIVATFAFAWWFRASNTRARYRPDWEFSGAIELVVWSIPFMVIILLGGVAWLGSHALDPAKPVEAHPSSARQEPLEIRPCRSTGSGSSSIRARASRA
jgi:hypothetical protein